MLKEDIVKNVGFYWESINPRPLTSASSALATEL